MRVFFIEFGYSKSFPNRMILCTGVSGDRSRIAKQPVGLVLDRTDDTTHHCPAGWKNGRGGFSVSSPRSSLPPDS